MRGHPPPTLLAIPKAWTRKTGMLEGSKVWIPGYANSYGRRGVVKRETIVETVITWEEIWIDVKLRHIADSRVVPQET